MTSTILESTLTAAGNFMLGVISDENLGGLFKGALFVVPYRKETEEYIL